MKAVYLCGGINNLTDVECRGWRDVSKEFLKLDTIDPMRRDFRGKEDNNFGNIVHDDLLDIEHADIVLVNAMKPSWGTAMEIVYAYGMGKVIIAFVDGNISPWLRYHCHHIFDHMMDAINFINDEYWK